MLLPQRNIAAWSESKRNRFATNRVRAARSGADGVDSGCGALIDLGEEREQTLDGRGKTSLKGSQDRRRRRGNCSSDIRHLANRATATR